MLSPCSRPSAAEPTDAAAEETPQERRIRLELVALRRKLIVALVLAGLIMLVMLPDLLRPMGETAHAAGFSAGHLRMGLLQLLLALPVQVWAGAQFYRAAWGALRERSANMSTLIALGTSAAFAFSVFSLVDAALGWGFLQPDRFGGPQVYFDSAATVIALILGSLAAFALQRYTFFGRNAISFVLVLPIALPGIVTGIALRSALNLMDLGFSFWTIVIGHATFCIVTVYNNVSARLRRTGASQIEASMDLGANIFQTFRYILLPAIATALLAGGMLAFALSFDEVIVTTFTAGQQDTLPIWILEQLTRPRDRPVTNVTALLVIAVTSVPILVAHWLSQRSENP